MAIVIIRAYLTIFFTSLHKNIHKQHSTILYSWNRSKFGFSCWRSKFLQLCCKSDVAGNL